MELSKKFCWRAGITVFLLYLAIYYWSSIAKIISLLIGAALPLILGGVLAYIFNILMSMFERHLFPKAKKASAARIRRFLSIGCSLLVILLILFLVIKMVVPEFVSCVNALIRQAPATINKFLQNPTILKYLPEDWEERLANLDWQSMISHIASILVSGVSGAVDAVSTIFSGVVTVMFALIFALYLLLGKETLSRQGMKLIHTYLPEKWQCRVIYTLNLLDKSFHKYIVGQVTEACILGGLCIIGMSIFRFPYATMIGTLVGVTALIPIAGAYIGAGVGAFMILSVSPVKAIWFLVFIILLQQFEGNIIYPRVVGSSIGLPGIFVLATITVGGAMFGILGMLVGVPLVAALYQALRDDVKRRSQTGEITDRNNPVPAAQGEAS